MPTRQELLAQCQAAGLKATGWKKEKMALELAQLGRLEAATSETPEAQADDTTDPDDEKPLASSSGSASPCGWCRPGPMWGRSHLTCRASSRHCTCECNAADWVRPEIPEGAQLSKYNREDREARGLPWEPIPGSQLTDVVKQAEGLKEVMKDDRTGDPGPAAGSQPAGLAGLVPAGAEQAGAPEPAAARAAGG